MCNTRTKKNVWGLIGDISFHLFNSSFSFQMSVCVCCDVCLKFYLDFEIEFVFFFFVSKSVCVRERESWKKPRSFLNSITAKPFAYSFPFINSLSFFHRPAVWLNVFLLLLFLSRFVEKVKCCCCIFLLSEWNVFKMRVRIVSNTNWMSCFVLLKC